MEQINTHWKLCEDTNPVMRTRKMTRETQKGALKKKQLTPERNTNITKNQHQ